jgi:hypothetical protein
VIDGLEGQIREQFAQLMRRAVDRGAVRDINADAVLDAVIGALFHRAMSRRDPSPEFVEQLLDLLLVGMLH